MRILFVADGRSPIALNWIKYFIDRGDEVHLVTTFACDQAYPYTSLAFIPVAFSTTKTAGLSQRSKKSGLWAGSLLGLRTFLRHWLGPWTIPNAAEKLRRHIAELQPELVHAMRIPYEGMLAAKALADIPQVPLLISVWGNDFTLHAPATPWMGLSTREALARADALHLDCHRDLRLAHQWGFLDEKPTIVLPGNGGIQRDVFYPLKSGVQREAWVINPRGFRSYIRNDTFFRSIPMVLSQHLDMKFFCPDMAGESQTQRWIAQLGIVNSVKLLPKLTRPELADLFRQALITVSPATHDGTPNTLLEAMACGCFPIAGDIESLREWITPGENGLLFDPSDPQGLAHEILKAFDDPEMCLRAAKINAHLIDERAEYGAVMRQADRLYQSLLR